MKKTLSTTIFFLLVASFAVAQSIYKDARTGITISFITDAEMYPESWRGGAIKGEATSLAETEYERSKSIVNNALNKYPVEVLTEHIKKVYVLDEIRFYGLRYGGTNSLDAVYISNRGLNSGYTDRYVEQLFHAEFSSILLRNLSYHLNQTTWEACNDESFTYGGSGMEAIKNKKAGEDFDPDFHRLGLLNQYASSNFENDVNSFAKNIFNPKPGFWDAIDQYPRIQCKIQLIISFYSQIDPSFNEEYFKKWK